MALHVNDGVVTVFDDDGPEIGFRAYIPSMQLYVGEGGVSISDSVGISANTQSCRFEVRSDGAVGVKPVDLR